jgi:hypothetical protein
VSEVSLSLHLPGASGLGKDIKIPSNLEESFLGMVYGTSLKGDRKPLATTRIYRDSEGS